MYSKNMALLIVGAVLVLAFASMASGGGMGFNMMGPGMMGGWAGPWTWVLWIVLAAGLYLLVTRTTVPRSRGHGGALAIAAERYARGEITAEEFEKIKDSLSRT